MIKEVIQSLGLSDQLTEYLLRLLVRKENTVLAWKYINWLCFIQDRNHLIKEDMDLSVQLEENFRVISSLIKSLPYDQLATDEDLSRLIELQNELERMKTSLHFPEEQKIDRLYLIFGYALISLDNMVTEMNNLLIAQESMGTLADLIQILSQEPILSIHPGLLAVLSSYTEGEKMVETVVAQGSHGNSSAPELASDQPKSEIVTVVKSELKDPFGTGKLPSFGSRAYQELLPQLLTWSDQRFSELFPDLNSSQKKVVIKAAQLEHFSGYRELEATFWSLFKGRDQKMRNVEWTISQVKLILIFLRYYDLNWGGGGIRPQDFKQFKNDLFEVLKQSKAK